MLELEVNGRVHRVDVDPETPLLWVIREHLRLTGTKFGCGIGLCGCCTVHLDGRPERSCQVSAGEAAGRRIVTIEGLAPDHPVKAAWMEEQVPQCGYCQPGQMMQAAGLLAANPNPSEAEIVAAMDGNLCRCGTYPRILRAVRRAAAKGGER
ncbi:(2Fe-2S)-binding protein [Dissulfurirhabdus thermomarina]|uniref:(2Fe-2S)-binding protein n=1 Tax=Dissulfurirhabdus thermomarina TaxID=1765737 RepID=A0A6N9TTA7_DISTH|nr:(2Fe-2S)-binding protein [Dissulfurirhabdus thermomarina]NDY43323.1 (2Fe-2S)-binding protein [Dissulfurirhabdus thermomarina]NMX24281.1 (2Fe-2S)-binding protein [Dissulfurirhabdus thermomarina]